MWFIHFYSFIVRPLQFRRACSLSQHALCRGQENSQCRFPIHLTGCHTELIKVLALTSREFILVFFIYLFFIQCLKEEERRDPFFTCFSFLSTKEFHYSSIISSFFRSSGGYLILEGNPSLIFNENQIKPLSEYTLAWQGILKAKQICWVWPLHAFIWCSYHTLSSLQLYWKYPHLFG